MTNADTINAALAEMEGECVHINEALYVHCYWDSNAYYLTRECLDCDDNVAIVDVFRREATFMDAIFPEWDAIPDRLSDGAYILGLVKKYHIEIGWYDDNDSLVDAEIYNKSCTDSIKITDESLEHAIALAAIKLWKESGG